MVRESGLVLWEVVASLFVVTLVAASAAAVLRAQGRDVRMIYEERVAWEAAAGQLALVEARGAPPEGTTELDVAGWAGWENLAQPKAVLVVRAVEPGLREAAVTVSWAGEKGVRRSVEARALLEAKP